MKFAITGATGQLGQFVVNALLKHTKAENIIALVRDFKKAESFKQQGIELREPYRVCRRLNILRDYSDEKTKLYPRN